MTDHTLTGQTWVAFTRAGAVGSVHRITDGFTFKLLSDEDYRGVYATLDAGKAALYANLLPGTDWPEFREH
jgi:hypothetical protein